MPNLYPTFNLPTIIPRQNPVAKKYYPAPFFDFDSGDFLFDSAGRVKIANGQEAFEQWCIKVCSTERGTKLAYSDAIGTEFEAAMKYTDIAAVKSSIVRTITESIMIHPVAEYVKNFRFTVEGEHVWVTFDVKGKDFANVSTLKVVY